MRQIPDPARLAARRAAAQRSRRRPPRPASCRTPAGRSLSRGLFAARIASRRRTRICNASTRSAGGVIAHSCDQGRKPRESRRAFRASTSSRAAALRRACSPSPARRAPASRRFSTRSALRSTTNSRASSRPAPSEGAPDPSGKIAHAGDPRAILRRGAARGFAEVDFVAHGRPCAIARAAISCARAARPRARCKSADAACGVSTKAARRRRRWNRAIEPVNRRIVELTDLTFDQFRRTALLAQGEFDAFLRADANERADLLEKITGADIYGLLSKRAFEHAREAQQASATLERRRADIGVTTEEERAAIEAQIAAIEAERAQTAETRRADARCAAPTRRADSGADEIGASRFGARRSRARGRGHRAATRDALRARSRRTVARAARRFAARRGGAKKSRVRSGGRRDAGARGAGGVRRRTGAGAIGGRGFRRSRSGNRELCADLDAGGGARRAHHCVGARRGAGAQNCRRGRLARAGQTRRTIGNVETTRRRPKA